MLATHFYKSCIIIPTCPSTYDFLYSSVRYRGGACCFANVFENHFSSQQATDELHRLLYEMSFGCFKVIASTVTVVVCFFQHPRLLSYVSIFLSIQYDPCACVAQSVVAQAFTKNCENITYTTRQLTTLKRRTTALVSN